MDKTAENYYGCALMGKSSKIINIETLEVYDSVTECAKANNVTWKALYYDIIRGWRCNGQLFEYLDYWEALTAKEKETHTVKNNIYFFER